MSSPPTQRHRLARAIEAGDPRLGLFVGAVIVPVLALAFSFALPILPAAQKAENAVLDTAFLRRPRILESDRILLVDIEDATVRDLGWPIRRDHYAQTILALNRLGARRIVFDVEFKTIVPRRGDYDETTGEYRQTEQERALRFAIGRSGKVILGYHIDLNDPLSPQVRKVFPALKQAFARNILADSAEVARETGLPQSAVKEELQGIRMQAVLAVVGDLFGADPKLTFADLRAKFLPQYDPQLHSSDLRILQFAYWTWRSTRLLETKAAATKMEGREPGREAAYMTIVPPLYFLLEHAQGVGFTNSGGDEDGVIRRQRTHLVWNGKPLGYLGFEAGMQSANDSEAVIRTGSVELRTSARQISIPLDDGGRLLVNWGGNHQRRRAFEHVPCNQIVAFYQTIYEDLDANTRKTITQVPEDERPEYMKEYVSLSGRLAGVLAGKAEAAPDEARGLEERMDGIRRQFIADQREDIRKVEEYLKTASPRVRERSLPGLMERKTQLNAMQSAYDKEAELRNLVEGKICLIGSASTASGDLQATPLGGATPGVDVHASVANMAITGQSLRRVPAGLNFLFLLVVGVLVSLAVTHWNTTTSALASIGLVLASGGLYWYLFTGPSLLISGAGPLTTALITFAGVTAFKQLVTQRSKRKLQRELVKNTSEELVKILMEHPEFLNKPRKMIGTFFFSDVKSFTSVSEKMAPEVLFPYINRYLDRMTRSLKHHQAFLDKYMGDGIMALFGIPVPTPHHARNACLAALENQLLLKQLNEEYKRDGLPQIHARIGIHSGEISAGYVGAVDRSDYTVLGDDVNLASRLEGANKEYDTSIMISGSTYDLIRDQFIVRELDRIRVVGKRNAVMIYELLAVVGGPLPVNRQFLGEYATGMKAFNERHWPEAVEAFDRALALNPGDKPCETHITRAQAFQLSPPPPDWEGAFELTSK